VPETPPLDPRSLRAATAALCVWLAAWPVPYALALTAVAALPWIALALCRQYRGLYAIDNPRRDDPRGDLTLMLAVPGGVLAMRALIDSHLALVGPVFLPALALWAAMVWCAHSLGPGWRSWRKLPLLIFVLFPYAPSTIALADQVFDFRAPLPERVRVLGKRVSTGKGAMHYLRVVPWGLRSRPNEIEVKRDLYDATTVGASVCLLVHPGALGMPWYEVGEC
jgi:hypothetical protein